MEVSTFFVYSWDKLFNGGITHLDFGISRGGWLTAKKERRS
jgi:hypothetical protein